MSAMDRIVELSSDRSGEGLCAVCHKPRGESGCRSSWKTSLGDDKTWSGGLHIYCESFPNDREQLAEALNRYHVRETTHPA